MRENQISLDIQTTILSRILRGIPLKTMTIKTSSIRGMRANINHSGGKIMTMLLGREAQGTMGRKILLMRAEISGIVMMDMKCRRSKRDLMGTSLILVVGHSNHRTIKFLMSTLTIQICTGLCKHPFKHLTDLHLEIKITTLQKFR